MDPQHPQPVHTHRKKLSGRTKLGLWLLLGPTILIAASFILFATTNFIFGNVPDAIPAECTAELSSGSASLSDEACQESLFGEQSRLEAFLNSMLFLAGAIGVLTWLPGLVIGIVLLATKVKTPHQPHQD